MLASECHYRIWSDVVRNLYDLLQPENERRLIFFDGSLTYMKRAALNNMVMCEEERRLLLWHSSCVLCMVHTDCKGCPLYRQYGKACNETGSQFDRCSIYICNARSGCLSEKRIDITRAAESAQDIRDIELPGFYNRQLLEFIREDLHEGK